MSTPHLIGLSYSHRIGPVGYKNLIAHLGDPEKAWHATRQELLAADIDTAAADAFILWRQTADLEKFQEDLARRQINAVTINNPAYPELLREIHDPPYVLYYRGILPPHDAMCVGIVGTRHPTAYGRKIAYDFAHDLVSAGAIVVSGMAQGIDQEAHRGAATRKGRTIAVLGSGLDAVDTGYKARIAENIISCGGAVLSEYPPNSPVHAWNFPVRNRIIAGLSKGTVVIEAAYDSGSLITARAALRENREIFAVPGSIYEEMSKGTNALLREGAHVATCAQDILTVLQPEMRVVNVAPNLTDQENAIYNLVLDVPQHIDDIIRQSILPPHQVTSMLAVLEMRGVIRNLGGMRYIR